MAGCCHAWKTWRSLRRRLCGYRGLYLRDQPFEVYARDDETFEVDYDVDDNEDGDREREGSNKPVISLNMKQLRQQTRC